MSNQSDDEFYEFYLDDKKDLILLAKRLNNLLKKIESKEKRLLVHVCFESRCFIRAKKGK